MDPTTLTRKIVDLAEWIGVSIHSGLRRLSDSPDAVIAYEAIGRMPDHEWRRICLCAAKELTECLRKTAESDTQKLPTYNREYSISYISAEGVACIENLSAPNRVDAMHIFLHIHPDFRDVQSVNLGWRAVLEMGGDGAKG